MTDDAAETLRTRSKVAATTHDVWTWEDERLVDLALGNLESALGRARKTQAALDRLAAVTVADGALAIGAGPIRPMDAAAAVLALVRARVAGRDG